MLRIGRTARGVLTVAQRRGVGYFGYLFGGVVVPRALYRIAWGPGAPRPVRALFRASAAVRGLVPSTDELAAAEIVGAGAPTTASVEEIETLMDRAHAAGITGLHDAFETLVRVDHAGLRFASLPQARKYPRRGAAFLAARDDDRRAFNARFNASVLTEADARRALRAGKAKVPPGYRDYAPIDFGHGLTIGQIASTDSGTGRWDFFNRHIVAPLVRGKRVLDLGSNNGSLPLMMLRAGAREVVAVEFTPEIADFARLNARILAWRDMRRYQFEVLTGDMRLFLSRDLGRFDVVTAFCSLYYLPEADMARIIEKAASMGATLVLQANDGIHNLPAQTQQLRTLMERNGYPDVQVHAPAGFVRPLLVGRPAPVAVSRELLAT
jgi:SAM-dependent methyltransferase